MENFVLIILIAMAFGPTLLIGLALVASIALAFRKTGGSRNGF